MARHPPRDRLPERPADIDPDMSAVALIDAYQRHLVQLAAERVDPSRSAQPDTGARAIAALAIAHAVVEGLFEERWPLVRDALARGVGPEKVGAAAGGLEPDELAAGLTAWADRRLAAGAMGVSEHRAVRALVGTRLRDALHGVG